MSRFRLSYRLRLNKRRLIIGSVAALVIIAALIVVLDYREWHRVIGQADLMLALPALAFTALSYVSLSYAFVVVNIAFGVRLPKRDLFDIGFVSTALGRVVSFAGVPEYSLRLLLMTPRGIPAEEVLAPSVFSSYLNNLIMFSLFPVGILHLLFGGMSRSSGHLVGFAVLGAIVVIGMALATAVILLPSVRRGVLRAVRRVWRLVTRRTSTPLLDAFDASLTRGTSALRARPMLLAQLVVLIVADWAFTVVALQFSFAALGSHIGFGALVTGFAVGVVAGVLSLVPGGLGVQEGSMAAVFALLGVPLHRAVLAAILFRIVFYFVPFIISLLFYRRLLVATNK